MKYLKIVNYALLVLVIYSAHTLIESIRIESQLSKFKESANVLKYELDENITFTFKQNDILLNRKSGHKNLLIRDIITFYTGGHSALVIDPEGLLTIEVFGYSGYYDDVRVYDNDWIQNEVEVIGVRTEDITLNYEMYLGRKYDWFPYLPNKQKYCTELITDTYTEAGLYLDYDFGIATVNDIILSRKTELFLYKEIRDGFVYIYWEE